MAEPASPQPPNDLTSGRSAPPLPPVEPSLGSVQEDIDRATIMEAMAAGEDSAELAALWRRVAERRRVRAGESAQALGSGAGLAQMPGPRWHARMLARMARRFGSAAVLPWVNRRSRGRGRAAEADEIARRMRLLKLLDEVAPDGVDGATIARLDSRHKAAGGNALRAAVLGANDGLVSNLSLVMGVAGANLGTREILITGIAGLLAGAFSMAMGEWISVQSSRELYRHELAIEAHEIATHPEAEEAELILIYRAKGIPADQARGLATEIMADRERALDAMAREELGIDPENLGGSPWQAAGASFALFFVGATPPVLPFALLPKTEAIIASLALSAIMLFIIGAAITLFTGRSPWASGLRQLVFGLCAGALTFGIGKIIGVSVA